MISQRIVTRVILAAAVIGAAFLLPACAEFSREEQLALLRLDQPVDRSDMSVQQLIEAIQKATDPDRKYYDTEKYLLKQQIVSEQENKDSRVSLVYITEIRYAKPDKIRWTRSAGPITGTGSRSRSASAREAMRGTSIRKRRKA